MGGLLAASGCAGPGSPEPPASAFARSISTAASSSARSCNPSLSNSRCIAAIHASRDFQAAWTLLIQHLLRPVRRPHRLGHGPPHDPVERFHVVQLTAPCLDAHHRRGQAPPARRDSLGNQHGFFAEKSRLTTTPARPRRGEDTRVAGSRFHTSRRSARRVRSPVTAGPRSGRAACPQRLRPGSSCAPS